MRDYLQHAISTRYLYKIRSGLRFIPRYYNQGDRNWIATNAAAEILYRNVSSSHRISRPFAIRKFACERVQKSAFIEDGILVRVVVCPQLYEFAGQRRLPAKTIARNDDRLTVVSYGSRVDKNSTDGVFRHGDPKHAIEELEETRP